MKQINTIEGLENIKDYYWISSYGKVISSAGKKPRVLKGGKTKKGYFQVCLMTNKGKNRWLSIHRLVAIAYIPNIENKPQVNHIDEIKAHNYILNLEWMTSKENNNHGTRNDRVSKTMKCNEKITGKNHYNSKTIEYYETNSVRRNTFKRTCKRQKWNFDSFDEKFVDWYVRPSGKRERKYCYFHRSDR